MSKIKIKGITDSGAGNTSSAPKIKLIKPSQGIKIDPKKITLAPAKVEP